MASQNPHDALLRAVFEDPSNAADELRHVAGLILLKFGVTEAELEGRLAAASLEQLEDWTERVLTAQSLQDVFR